MRPGPRHPLREVADGRQAGIAPAPASLGGATTREVAIVANANKPDPAGVTREEVVLAFRLLLGREPESEAAIEGHRHLPGLAALRETIMRSAEYRHHAPPLAAEPERRAGDSVRLAAWGFGRDGEAGFGVREGWSAPEPEFCWTTGEASRVELPLPAVLPSDGLVLEVALAAFHHPQRLSLRVGECRLAECVVRGATVLAVPVPAGLLDGQAALVLSLHHPDAVRPCDVSASADDRRLGLAVRWVALATLPPAAAGPEPAELLQGFQNLGENCEFGFLLQRHAAGGGGLLRFSGLPHDQLLRGLATRFEGFPDRARMRLERHATRTGGEEAMVIEEGYGLVSHTGVADERLRHVDEATLLDREAVRLGWLRRLFVEELEDGRTIFVYRTRPARSLAEMTALWLALRRLGTCTLLWVVEAEPELPAGSVLVLGEGFLKGFAERLAPVGNTEDLHLEGWLALCRQAVRLARAGEDEPDAGPLG